MRLRRLSLHGFKSFADRTELQFHSGITAVVGPNGCGKSNISDAIRWVLGEQRASAIRGSKMEEAIFQGTAERRPVNRAEVSLVFSNDEGRLAVPYDEIEIRRTIFREGGSEYHLNRTACRLKDIFDLFRDTGLGTNAYTVIEQRMVDGILSDRTDDRRLIFEEAAGVGRYKDRRKAAQRRLEAAEADLGRLEDLITEVDSKVRSLARQRRKAQRYEELRARRLALEVTLAATELGTNNAELQRITARLAELIHDEPSTRAALSVAEAELERRKLEAVEAGRIRAAHAAKLEEVNRRIADRDRELAITEERLAHAEKRLAQIATERVETTERITTLETEIATLSVEREERRVELETLSEEMRVVQSRQQALREEVAEARRLGDEARAWEQELGRRASEAEAAAMRAEARVVECNARLERLKMEREALEDELSRLEEQGDLFADRARELAAALAERESERDECAERLAVLRAREAEARRAYTEAEDRSSLLAAQLAAIEALERDYDGFLPQVAAALAARDRLDGLLGSLAEFLQVDAERAAGIEHALGSLLQILVVRDADTVERIRTWLATEGGDQGVVALLEREFLPQLTTILEAVAFAGESPSEAVLLGRRERLAVLRDAVAAAEEECKERDRARTELGVQVAATEEELRERNAAIQSIGLELHRVEAEESTSAGQRGRLVKTLEELDNQVSALIEAMGAAREEAAAAREEYANLQAELGAHRSAWDAESESIGKLEAEWESIRDEGAERRVVHARLESACAELDRRIAAASSGLDQARTRLNALVDEEAEHRLAIERLATVREEAGDQLEDLFRERDTLAEQLRGLDERMAEIAEAVDALESQVRMLRRSGEERVEERHRLELRRAELEAASRNVRERLEVEWGRPYERLAAEIEFVEGEVHQLRAELQALAADIERLGPINMLAIEEHEEENARLTFLTTQRDDLIRARDDLQTAIRQINRQARELFMETFEQIRLNFRRTFQTLFEGGTCDLWLENPDDPLESDVEISASPGGKRTQRIHLLSGGERALTALSLLFAVYLVKPSPFCVLDEVDAPLDEANVGRFVAMLQEFKAETQFIVITHNPRTMEAADWIYGVTMEEPGVSSIVGVQLDEALAGAAAGSRG